MTRSLTLVATVLFVANVLFPSGGYAFSWRKNTTEQRKLVVPDFRTAKEQYQYAVALHNSMIPSVDKTRRRQQLDRIIQCYSKVVENFPDDTVHTPVAYVTIAEAYAELGQDTKADMMFREAMQRWSANDYVMARCMFDMATSLDKQKRFSESQQLYKEIMERFKGSQKPGVADIVARAQARYYVAKEEPIRKAKKSPLKSFFERLKSLGK
ncbi:MAG: tetratricopeptide repeat protein [Candidatus Sumerlaeaceae bacterium]|nr:tetratricopeptide repeat protein [Candidatus Sumerlaeaceae bacterium]